MSKFTFTFVDEVQHPCRTCGACCVQLYPTPEADAGWAAVTYDDKNRLRRTERAQVRPLTRDDALYGHLDPDVVFGHTRLAPVEDTEYLRRVRRCVFFDGAVGSTCSCRINARKPTVCSTFRVGGAACANARRAFGMAPVPVEFHTPEKEAPRGHDSAPQG